jgi:hypothetical protein
MTPALRIFGIIVSDYLGHEHSAGLKRALAPSHIFDDAAEYTAAVRQVDTSGRYAHNAGELTRKPFSNMFAERTVAFRTQRLE